MKIKMKITDVKKETHDTATLTLKGDEKLEFRAGQFVMVQLLREGVEIPKRAYSISSSPERDYIQITVKQTPEGYVSKLLNEAKAGEEIMVEGPFGHFAFDSETMKDVVLIGAGSGVAPLKSICEYINDKKLPSKVTFIYSNKTEGDIIFHDYLRKAGESGNVELCLTLTREEKEGFYCGRLDDEMIGGIVEKNRDAHYFLCGPRGMVDCVKEILAKHGVESEKVSAESFG